MTTNKDVHDDVRSPEGEEPSPWLQVRLHVVPPPPPPPVRLTGIISLIPAGSTVSTLPTMSATPTVPTLIQFAELHRKLSPIKFFGTTDDHVPEGDDLIDAVKEGSNFLPKCYIDQYANPLESNLRRLQRLAAAKMLGPGILETLAGAVYQHNLRRGSAASLRRFLAVISNFYRSFLADEKRANINVRLSTCLPPLAVFQRDGGDGPFIICSEWTRELIDARTGVVSLPATYASHPILWGALAHEVAGHDVTHADPGLIDDLAKGVQPVCADMPTGCDMTQKQLSRLWSYWIDEATADVYGILNMGPAFILNQAVFFAAMLGDDKGRPPKLRMESRSDPRDPSEALDPHPTDILRLHLAAGVIDTLAHLSPFTRIAYNTLIENLSGLLATGDTIALRGNIAVERDHFEKIDFDDIPLSAMQDTARRVGSYIATAAIPALAGHSIQAIETWDDSDEAQSMAVRDALLAHGNIASLGDDAQLLAGSTMALLQDPTLDEWVTHALNDGLDMSFRRDPIWGKPASHRAIVRYGQSEQRTKVKEDRSAVVK